MAGKKENLKALFTNTRSRVIIIFTFALLAVAIIVGFLKFSSLGSTEKSLGDSGVSNTPAIQSIPGAIDPTIQYAQLQETQNETQAQTALKKGGSAIPTIVRSQNIGNGTVPIGVQAGEGGVGFSTLSMSDQAGEQRGSWLLALQNNTCNKQTVDEIVSQGAQPSDLKAGCSCIQLKSIGYPLKDLEKICSCKELRAAGVNARQLKNMGYTVSRLRECGFDACELRNAGFTAQQMIDGGYTTGEMKGAGYPDNEIKNAGGVPDDASIKAAGCDPAKLKYLLSQGVSAKKIHDLNGCSAAQLTAAGYNAQALLDAGFPPVDDATIKAAGCDPIKLKNLLSQGVSAKQIHDLNGCSAAQLTAAGYNAQALLDAGFPPVDDASIKAAGCDPIKLKNLLSQGVSAKQIHDLNGCSAAQLKAAGYNAQALLDAGLSPVDEASIKAAGCDPIKLKYLLSQGVSAKQIQDLNGCTAAQLNAAGFKEAQLPKDCSVDALRAARIAGVSAGSIKASLNCSAAAMKAADFTDAELNAAGYAIASSSVSPDSQVADLTNPIIAPSISSTVPALPSIVPQKTDVQKTDAETAQQLQKIVERQNRQMADQKYQQKIQQRTSLMLGVANQSLQNWKRVNAQAYIAGNPDKEKDKNALSGAAMVSSTKTSVVTQQTTTTAAPAKALIKTGDILFAVIDTSVNSDEPGPILATVISGRLKGAKLIGSFNLPANAEKMIISFNTMSVPGASHSTSISAVAIDANTARTALSSKTDTHFWYRYGNLFASSFLSGLGDAFQSADTTVTVGSTGAGDSITVQNGIGRSLLQNTVIALGDVGQAWSQVAQQNFSIPTTVEVYSGTGIGVLFTQDLTSL